MVALTALSGCNASERPMAADIASAADVPKVYLVDCRETRDGKPGFLCWYRDDYNNALGSFIRLDKGWFGWKKIGND